MCSCRYIVAQTTNSGSSNPILANELQKMFVDCEDPISWDSLRNQIRCYCHKFALTVKSGLEVIGLGDNSQTKPTVPSGKRLRPLLPKDYLPPPKIVMADGTVVDKDGVPSGDTDSEEDAHELVSANDKEFCDDSEDEQKASDYKIQNPDASLLPQAVTKVSKFIVDMSHSIRH